MLLAAPRHDTLMLVPAICKVTALAGIETPTDARFCIFTLGRLSSTAPFLPPCEADSEIY